MKINKFDTIFLVIIMIIASISITASVHFMFKTYQLLDKDRKETRDWCHPPMCYVGVPLPDYLFH